jgi:protoheme IX farnesyltransferase
MLQTRATTRTEEVGIPSGADTSAPYAPVHPIAAVGMSQAFRVYVRVLVVATVLLLVAGALVTTTGSGLSVPDWPLAFGLFFPRMEGGVLFEHGHRLFAALVGFLTLVAAVWATVVPMDKTTRRLSWLALGMVIAQGLLGGLTVLLRLPTSVSVAHGCLAQLFFCSTVALLLFTSRNFRRAEPIIQGAEAQALRMISVTALLVVFCQLLIGATMRHMGAGLVISDFPKSLGQWIPPITSPQIAINFTHRVFACVVFTVEMYYASRLIRSPRAPKNPLRALGFAIIALVCCQVTLGALTVWSGRGLVPTCAHVVNGALVLGTTFASLLWVCRLTGSLSSGLFTGDGVAAPAEGSASTYSLAKVSRKDWLDLFKVRLVTMSAFTAGLAFWMGSQGSPDFLKMGLTVIGVTLVGASGGALNQVYEVEVDRCMTRTRNRPLVAGRISLAAAECIGCVLGAAGILLLGILVHPLSGLLGALALVTYVLIYTPLKRTTSLCTFVGAIPGALPILAGYTGATGRIDLEGSILFLIMFMWQLPHFMAIAWLCKEDYAAARMPMVTVIDPAGDLAGYQSVFYCLALLPISLAPCVCGMNGFSYFLIALTLGLYYLYWGCRLSLQKNGFVARKLLLASVTYLPLIFLALVFTRTNGGP